MSSRSTGSGVLTPCLGQLTGGVNCAPMRTLSNGASGECIHDFDSPSWRTSTSELRNQTQVRPSGSTGCSVEKNAPESKGSGASQTGRLHVWETWDHEDPEFRTDQQKRSCRKPVSKVCLVERIGSGEDLDTGMRSTHAFHHLCNPAGLRHQKRVSATFRSKKSRNTAMRLECRNSSG